MSKSHGVYELREGLSGCVWARNGMCGGWRAAKARPGLASKKYETSPGHAHDNR